MNRKLRGIGMLLTVTMIWGSGFIATEYAIQSGMPAAWIMAIRFLVGALLIGAVFFRRVFPLSRKALIPGSCAGIILFAAFYTQTVGQGSTTVSNAAFLTATNVVMIPILLWLFTKKRPQLKVFLLCAVTMAGVILLSLDTDFQLSFGWGDGMVLRGAVCAPHRLAWPPMRKTRSGTDCFYSVMCRRILRPGYSPAFQNTAYRRATGKGNSLRSLSGHFLNGDLLSAADRGPERRSGSGSGHYPVL